MHLLVWPNNKVPTRTILRYTDEVVCGLGAAVVAIDAHGKKASVASAVGDGRAIVAGITAVRLVAEICLSPCAVEAAGFAAVAGLGEGDLAVRVDGEGGRLTALEGELEECVAEGTSYGARVTGCLVVVTNFVP